MKKQQTNPTAQDTLIEQHSIIATAIEKLQSELDRMTDEVNIESVSWKDVASFAHSSELSREIIEFFESE